MTPADAICEPRTESFAMLVGPQSDTCRDCEYYYGFHSSALLSAGMGTAADQDDAPIHPISWGP
jgi:hypothetical protein